MLTPTNDVKNTKTSFLSKNVDDLPMKVKTFAKHPKVVSQPEILRRYQKRFTAYFILQERNKPIFLLEKVFLVAGLIILRVTYFADS